MKGNIKNFIYIFSKLNYILSNKQKRKSVVVLLLVIIGSFFELLGVTAVFPFIQAVLTPDELKRKWYISNIVEQLNINSDKEMMLFIGIIIIAIYIVKNLFLLWCYYLQYSFATKIQKDLAISMYKAYLNHPYTFFLTINSADLIRGCNNDTGGVCQIITILLQIVSECLTVLLISVFILFTDIWTSLAIILLMLIVLVGMILLFKPLMKRAGKKTLCASSKILKILNQTFQGIKEIFVTQNKEIFIGEFTNTSEDYRKEQRTYYFISNCPERIIEGICVSGLIGIICIRLWVNADMTEFVPKLGAFAMAAFRILPSIGKITGRVNNLVFYYPTLENVYETLKNTEEHNNAVRRYEAGHRSGRRKTSEIAFTSELSINDIAWQYEENSGKILDHVSLNVKKGESIALIGKSGSGKTTLVDIILGLLQPQQGSIEIDGIDVYSIRNKWSSIVGYVPQSVYLLDDTVRRNICFASDESEIDDDRVWEVLESAQLKNFVEALPNGLDTIVGERGIRFSGGQKQRVAIARALYGTPDILILDEATAALDNETETAVMEAIDSLQGKITMIIVAHRLTTIKNCDKIYEIIDGKAIERNKNDVLQGIV